MVSTMPNNPSLKQSIVRTTYDLVLVVFRQLNSHCCWSSWFFFISHQFLICLLSGCIFLFYYVVSRPREFQDAFYFLAFKYQLMMDTSLLLSPGINDNKNTVWKMIKIAAKAIDYEETFKQSCQYYHYNMF